MPGATYHRRMATLLAHITVKPGCEAAFEEIARPLYEATHAEETGVRRYEYWRGAEPQTYYCLLAFDDHRAFIAHQTSDHHEGAVPQLHETIEELRLEWLDPVQGASPLPPTEEQDAPPEATGLVAEYTYRYAADLAPWWSDLRTGS